MSLPIQRRNETITLGELFEKNDEGPIRFNSVERTAELRYRIPSHQRHPQWKIQQKQLLIDTVMRNYPMTGITVSEHVLSSQVYYDIEDGQSRLSILQDFYNDAFDYTFPDGVEYKFSTMPLTHQRRFENYRINIEILSGCDVSAISEVFQRLQYGEPLKDCDLYWNRKEYTYIAYALELFESDHWRNQYMKTTTICDTNRKSICDIVTIVYAILEFDNETRSIAEDTGRKCMTASFRYQVHNLNKVISKRGKERIVSFFNYLNSIIDEIYSSPRASKEHMTSWSKLSKQTGMILYEWLTTDMADNKTKWVEIMQIERQSANFMYKGTKTMWNGMRSGNRQNTNASSVKIRVERVNQFYENKQDIASEYRIRYVE